MRYLHVMSRPKVIDHEHDTVWTEAYVDSAVSVPSIELELWPPVIVQYSFPKYSMNRNINKNLSYTIQNFVDILHYILLYIVFLTSAEL